MEVLVLAALGWQACSANKVNFTDTLLAVTLPLPEDSAEDGEGTDGKLHNPLDGGRGRRRQGPLTQIYPIWRPLSPCSAAPR